MRPTMLVAAGLFALPACAVPSGGIDGPVRLGAQAACDATEAQAMIGKRATADLGAELLAVSGARALRWVPPRTAVTMDFRPDRLTVSYNDAMTIERISCG